MEHLDPGSAHLSPVAQATGNAIHELNAAHDALSDMVEDGALTEQAAANILMALLTELNHQTDFLDFITGK